MHLFTSADRRFHLKTKNNCRKELQRKDNVLHTLALKKTSFENNYAEESDGEKVGIYLSEMKKLQEAYEDESEGWKKQKETLIEQNDELSNEIEKLKLQTDSYGQSLKVLEESDDEVRKAFAIKSKEYIEVASELLIAKRKNDALQQQLNKETMKAYRDQKEGIKTESYLRKTVADTNKYNKILEREISTLQSNLSNSVSNTVYNELKEKHEELGIRHRCLLENNLVLQNNKEIQMLKAELELLKQEKNQLMELLQKEVNHKDDRSGFDAAFKRS